MCVNAEVHLCMCAYMACMCNVLKVHVCVCLSLEISVQYMCTTYIWLYVCIYAVWMYICVHDCSVVTSHYITSTLSHDVRVISAELVSG